MLFLRFFFFFLIKIEVQKHGEDIANILHFKNLQICKIFNFFKKVV